MASPRRYNTKELTNHLRELAAEAHDWTEAEGVLTKGEALARLLWRTALGWTEKKVDDEGTEQVVTHAPAAWAIQLVYDRMEGKTPVAVEENEQRLTAAERVSDLAKGRLNALTEQTVGAKPSGPPMHRPKGKPSGPDASQMFG
jgi:hypothetical protein